MGTPHVAATVGIGERPRRGAWVTAAAIVLMVEGGLGLLYVPNLMGASLGPLQPVGILICSVSALSMAAGIGLLSLRRWARLAAGGLAVVSLVFMYAPALVVAVAHGVWLGFDWLGIVAFLVVLFAVVRRWPA